MSDMLKKLLERAKAKGYIEEEKLKAVEPELPELQIDSDLIGKKIVFTGRLSTMTRDAAKEKARSAGALPADSVSSRTDILVCGEGSGSKKTKAEKLGIQIISEDDFLAMLDGNITLLTKEAGKAHKTELRKKIDQWVGEIP